VGYADSIRKEPEQLPQCWGLQYEANHPECMGCWKGASCRGQFLANHRTVPATVVTSTPQVQAPYRPAAGGPVVQYQQQPYQYSRIEDRRMDFTPKPGENQGERLAKNIGVAIIQAICQQIYHFFDVFRF
jgi:hypothetical protein